MFFGWVRERGRLIEVAELLVSRGASAQSQLQGGIGLVIGHSPQLGVELHAGAGLLISGVYSTIIEVLPDACAVELSPETLRHTTLGELRQGSEVNLEPAKPLGDLPVGHWIRGQVDAITEVVERRDFEARSEVGFALAGEYRDFVVENGKVALDGVSLTVASLAAGRFDVELFPRTLEVTTLGSLEVGDRVNLEVDARQCAPGVHPA